ASTATYPLSLHDALPILLHNILSSSSLLKNSGNAPKRLFRNSSAETGMPSAVQNDVDIMCLISSSFPFFNFTFTFLRQAQGLCPDRKSTRLNSSHVKISY